MSQNRQSQADLRIYLLNLAGELIWSNLQMSDDEALLHSAFISALANFSKEFIVEDLVFLQINDVRIKLFPLLDNYIIALFLNSNYKDEFNIILKRIEEKLNSIIKTNENHHLMEYNQDDLIPIIIALLNDINVEINQEINHQGNKLHTLNSVFFYFREHLVKNNFGLISYDSNGKIIFKYLPESIIHVVETKTLFDISNKMIPFLTNVTNISINLDSVIIYLTRIGNYYFAFIYNENNNPQLSYESYQPYLMLSHLLLKDINKLGLN